MSASDRAVERGIAFLTSAQAPDGSFTTELSDDMYFNTVVHEQLTTFTPALLLQVLAFVPGTREIRWPLSKWLLGQQDQQGAFNYWPCNAPQRKTKPYPNDLDDTACALAGLYLHDPKLLDSAQLANMVRLLIAAETEVGGPYRTWLVHKNTSKQWQDVDLVVNCNIQYLLQLVAEPLPKLAAMIGGSIGSDGFQSSYYPIPIAVCYFLARVCPPANRSRLANFIVRQQKDSLWQSPLQTAWACSALCRLGVRPPQKALEYLLAQQRADGSWPAEFVWLDERRGPRPRYAGSSSLSTAFALEALSCSYAPQAKQPPTNKTLRPAFQDIVLRVKRDIDTWPFSLRPQAQMMLEKVQQGDTGQELVLLPQLFAGSLRHTNTSADLLAVLSAANVFGWMAYRIYDDFLDSEGQVSLLPVANTAMRASLRLFRQALPNDQAFQRQVQSLFIRIDAANAWEATHCRIAADSHSVTVGALPKYPSATFLAERSIGHALTPLAVLAASGIPADHPKARLFLAGFRHYLAARQLHDDLHDWQEDLRNGRISYIVARLLRDSEIKPARLSIAVLLPQLERQFWYASLPELCAETKHQLEKTNQSWAAAGLFLPENDFFQCVARLDRGIQQTLEAQKNALDFLRSYLTST